MEENCDLSKEIRILELGYGNGSFWIENASRIPAKASIVLSDKSNGMISDARRNIGLDDKRFEYDTMDCDVSPFPYEDNSFDIVIANHVMFYCEDINQTLGEIKRILKKDGVFLCSTYGSKHMREISELVQEFDNRIVLSAEKLYERFGLEHGAELLQASII